MVRRRAAAGLAVRPSLGRRHRDSGRRRKAPRPEHGTSARPRVEGPGPPGGSRRPRSRSVPDPGQRTRGCWPPRVRPGVGPTRGRPVDYPTGGTVRPVEPSCPPVRRTGLAICRSRDERELAVRRRRAREVRSPAPEAFPRERLTPRRSAGRGGGAWTGPCGHLRHARSRRNGQASPAVRYWTEPIPDKSGLRSPVRDLA